MFQINGYQVCGGSYGRNGITVTDFTLDVLKIVTPGTDKFKFLLYKGNEGIEMEVALPRLKGRRFFNDIPVSINAEEEAQFYASLRRAVLNRQFSEEETIYETGKNGLQEVCGKRVFVFTNGSICDTGFYANIYSGIGGAYFPEKALLDLADVNETVEKLFVHYNRNAAVFYPLFLFNVMAISNKFFQEIGEQTFMKLTLWIDGASGSGKTELARCAGNYAFYDADLERELVSVTAKRNYALLRLSKCSGTSYILDDVKKESVRERRNSTRNIVDDVIRSVFQGRVTDTVSGIEDGTKKIDACAVITGEFLETNESQNARLFYLKTDGFLKKKSNSDALRVLQEHPLWLTTVCGGYIRWFLKKMQEGSFPEFLKAELKGLRAKDSRYTEINNAERLNENVHMLEMAAILTGQYFREIKLSGKFMTQFYQNAKTAIRKISDDTFGLLGGAQMVFLKILENMFSNSMVREAPYVKGGIYSSWKYKQPCFWLSEDDDFVWIEDYGKSLETEKEARHNIRNTGAFLLIRERRFDELFQAETKKLVKEGEVPFEMADRLFGDCKKMLREMQIIFKQYRTDCKWGRAAVEYPVFEQHYERGSNWYGEENEYETCIFAVNAEPVMHLNIAHPSVQIIKERIGQADCEGKIIFDFLHQEEICGMDENEIWKLRKSFASGKELYRK